MEDRIEALRGGLIVACHAKEGGPLDDPNVMAPIARAAVLGGAAGIRAVGVEHVRAIRRAVDVPLIGLVTVEAPDWETVRITPTMEIARAVVEAGVDFLAVQATQQPRPGGVTSEHFIRMVKDELRVPVVADISTYEEGVAAARAGADMIATTLAGYTPQSPRKGAGCDLELVRALVQALSVPVLAQGFISTPEEAREALETGAHAVVVGTMIIRPESITERFVVEIGRARAA